MSEGTQVRILKQIRFREEFHGTHWSGDGLGSEEGRRSNVSHSARSASTHHVQQGLQELFLRRQQDHRQHDVCRLSGGEEGLVSGNHFFRHFVVAISSNIVKLL